MASELDWKRFDQRTWVVVAELEKVKPLTDKMFAIRDEYKSDSKDGEFMEAVEEAKVAARKANDHWRRDAGRRPGIRMTAGARRGFSPLGAASKWRESLIQTTFRDSWGILGH
jgi:hypothetical protein